MKNHYPAIDVLKSISRLMPEVAGEEHLELANRTRTLLATYEEYEDLIAIGAYKKGSNEQVDEAIRYHEPINAFLRQKVEEHVGMEQTLAMLQSILS